MEHKYSADELYLPYNKAVTNNEKVTEDSRDYRKDNFYPHRPSQVTAL